MVSWTLAELLRAGLVDAVAHVAPTENDRLFEYRISRTIEEIEGGAKSRYHPVEMSGVLAEIRRTPGRYAIVGVPCFIKAVQLLRREDPKLQERIVFTLGLFCGHMKSARMIESFAWQMGTDVSELRRVEHRIKDPSRPASTYTAEVELKDGEVRRKDWWNLADGDWGAGFFMNPACDWCDDVIAETADISFGDAWVEPYSSDGNGTNVVVVRSPVVAALVETAIGEGRLHLETVDADFVQQTQAAGFRHRREGLAYRLTWRKRGLRPVKRVAPDRDGVPPRRRMVYRMRRIVSRGSNRMFHLARVLHWPGLYVRWARLALGAYHAFAYSRGKLGALVDRFRPDA
ncbi:coenzyme F420 hydrogenase, partial [bacterium]